MIARRFRAAGIHALAIACCFVFSACAADPNGPQRQADSVKLLYWDSRGKGVPGPGDVLKASLRSWVEEEDFPRDFPRQYTKYA